MTEDDALFANPLLPDVTSWDPNLQFRAGLSGWSYSNWKGKFYPSGLATKDQLAYCARTFPTLELNSTFYRLARPSTYEKWEAAAPKGFQFAVKGWRMVTQYKRLKDVAEPIAQFLGSGPIGLGKKLGPILWQLPPSLTFDEDVLRAFFELLPKTLGEAQTFVENHAPENVSNAALDAASDVAAGAATSRRVPQVAAEDATQPIRYSMEPRNATFFDPAAAALMKEYGVAMVVADSAGRHPQFNEVTTDFTYVRLHGSPRIYYSNYSPEVLEDWAERIKVWLQKGIKTYIYFDNTALGYAPKNALSLEEMLRETSGG